MDKKVISLDEYIKDKFIEELPKTFDLEDAINYSAQIENYINNLYNLALEDKKYHSLCTQEQIKTLSSIYMSFFRILYSEIEDFDESEQSNRIMLKFLSELYKICESLPDIEVLKQDDSSKIMKYENKEN